MEKSLANTLLAVIGLVGLLTAVSATRSGGAEECGLIVPKELDYGQVSLGKERALNVTMTNSGKEPLNVTVSITDGTAACAIDTNATPPLPKTQKGTLAAGEQKIIKVLCAPKGTGPTSAVVTVSAKECAEAKSIKVAIEGIK
jgi:hypothetical protein